MKTKTLPKTKMGYSPLPMEKKRNPAIAVRFSMEEMDRLSEPFCRQLMADDVRELAMETTVHKTKKHTKK